ncbi:hypothetical protein Hanom_Chr09g00844011 [Helianthus anomalus]
MIPSSNFSLMKCRSTSTCFVRSCWTGFSEICIAALLSHMILVAVVGRKPIFVRSLRIHRISARPRATPRNSASALDRATTFCCLLLQVTRFPPTMVKYPEVDLLVPLSPAQSASV